MKDSHYIKDPHYIIIHTEKPVDDKTLGAIEALAIISLRTRGNNPLETFAATDDGFGHMVRTNPEEQSV